MTISGIVYSKDPIFKAEAYKRSVFGDTDMTFFSKGRELRFTTQDESIMDILSTSSNISWSMN